MTVRLHVGCDSVILSHFAGLAPLWIVSQPLVREEKLLSSAENKLFAAVDAPQNLVLVFVHLGLLYLTGWRLSARVDRSYNCRVVMAASLWETKPSSR